MSWTLLTIVISGYAAQPAIAVVGTYSSLNVCETERTAVVARYNAQYPPPPVQVLDRPATVVFLCVRKT